MPSTNQPSSEETPRGVTVILIIALLGLSLWWAKDIDDTAADQARITANATAYIHANQ